MAYQMADEFICARYPHLTLMHPTAIIDRSAVPVYRRKRSIKRGLDDNDNTAHPGRTGQNAGASDLRGDPFVLSTPHQARTPSCADARTERSGNHPGARLQMWRSVPELPTYHQGCARQPIINCKCDCTPPRPRFTLGRFVIIPLQNKRPAARVLWRRYFYFCKKCPADLGRMALIRCYTDVCPYSIPVGIRRRRCGIESNGIRTLPPLVSTPLRVPQTSYHLAHDREQKYCGPATASSCI